MCNTELYDDDVVIEEVSLRLMSNYSEARRVWLDMNEMFWSYAKSNKILIFFHAKDGSSVEACLQLRNSIKLPPAMPNYEYFDINNHYCVCYSINTNIVVVGFILYRCYNNVIHLLDIVFDDSWNTNCNDLKEIDLEYYCVRAFCKFVNDIDYRCRWRKSLYLMRNFIKPTAIYKSNTKQYKSRGLQKHRVGKNSNFVKIENRYKV